MEPITDQVTGLQTGTPQADVITGRVIDRSIETSTVDSGVLNATINSLKGEDRISGFAELASTVSGAAIDATGISQSNIDGGLDADNVFSRGVGVGARSESTGEFQDPVLGRGILRSSVKGGNGRDQLNFIGVASEGLTLTATGVESSSIDGGGGTDSVFAVANAFGIDTSGTGTVTSTGSVNGVIRGGGQNDLIVIQSTANAANPGDGFEARGVAIATSADSSFVSGDGGDDTITVTASAGGNTQQDGSGAVRAEIQGIVNSEFRGGSGNDRISINTSVLQSSPSGNIASATFNIGLAENSVAAGDGGNDEIVIDVSSDSETSNSFGVRQARVKGGDGTDEIVIAARTNNFTGTVYGVSDAEVDGGNDDDTITITADWNGAVFVNGASADRSTVRVVASATAKGTSSISARVWANSVLPQPVGPISRMLLLCSRVAVSSVSPWPSPCQASRL